MPSHLAPRGLKNIPLKETKAGHKHFPALDPDLHKFRTIRYFHLNHCIAN